MIRLSLDTETLGISPGSQILQIACVDIDCPSDFFNVYADQAGQADYGLTCDATTIAWWQEQNPFLRNKVFSGSIPLGNALSLFSAWLTDVRGHEKVEIYMNSPSFDSLSILAPAYEATGQNLPWEFYEERDFRTLKSLGATYFDFLYLKPDGAHDALVDAKAQAEYIYQLTQRMKQRS